METNANKTLLLEQLKKTPIVEAACQKLNIGRSTYYYWRREDKEFAKQADEALREGSLLVNDLAESQLIAAIKDGNMSGIIFWLRNNHATYKNRLDITAHLEKEEALSPEQEAVVKEALRLASLSVEQPKDEASAEVSSENVAQESSISSDSKQDHEPKQ